MLKSVNAWHRWMTAWLMVFPVVRDLPRVPFAVTLAVLPFLPLLEFVLSGDDSGASLVVTFA